MYSLFQLTPAAPLALLFILIVALFWRLVPSCSFFFLTTLWCALVLNMLGQPDTAMWYIVLEPHY